ncbi:ATP-binding protein, partial [Symmachiella dynata]|uniref:ATP-binding protein n=1 Tax=Symmachiella dynata TaxID=2527995 RepID=UPI0030EDF614
ARGLGCQVYEGRCFDGNRAPFHPFIEIIRDILSGLKQRSRQDDEATAYLPSSPAAADIARAQAVVDNYRAELLRIAPDLRRWLPGEAYSQADFATGSEYIFRAIASFFIELSTVQPLCLCIDDLQWADPSTLDLLKHLAASLADLQGQDGGDEPVNRRLAVICTARTGYRGVSQFLSQLESQNLLLTVSLAPLNRHETEKLIALRLNSHVGEIAAEFTKEIDRFCRGNPFFISETVREWYDRGQIARSQAGWRLQELRDDDSSLPSSVRDALRSRLFGLSAGSRKLLEPAAVIGAVVDLDLLSEVVEGLSEDEYLDEIDELIQHRIFRETRNAARVEFAHDLLRELVSAELSAHRSRALHRRVAGLLEQRRESNPGSIPAAVLAEHFRAADDGPKAFGYYLEAGRAALDAYAFADALRQLTAAEDLLPDDADSRTRFELYEMLGITHTCLLQLDESDAAFHSALVHAPDDISRGKVHLGIAKNMQNQNRTEAAIAAYDAALEILGYKRSRRRVKTIADINLSAIRVHMLPAWTMRLFESEERRRRAEIGCETMARLAHVLISVDVMEYVQVCMMNTALAKSTENATENALALSKYSLNLYLSGFYRFGMRYARLAQRFADEGGRPDIQAIAKCMLGACYYMAGQLDAAEQELMQALPTFERNHDVYYDGVTHHWWRHVHSVRGNSVEIIRRARMEISCAERTGIRELSGWGFYGLTHGLALAGQHEQASDAALHSLDDLGNSIMRPISLQEQGFARLQASDFAGAVSAFQDAQNLMWRNKTYFELFMYTYPRMAEARLGPFWANVTQSPSGRELKVAAHAAKKAGLAGRFFPNCHPHALRILGRVAFAKGRHKQARRYFDKSMEAATKLGARYDLARALLDSSLAFPELEDRRQQGETLLEELGAVIPEIEWEQFPK